MLEPRHLPAAALDAETPHEHAPRCQVSTGIAVVRIRRWAAGATARHGAGGLAGVLDAGPARAMREQRAFDERELPALIEQATGVDVRAIIDEWMKPLP